VNYFLPLHIKWGKNLFCNNAFPENNIHSENAFMELCQHNLGNAFLERMLFCGNTFSECVLDEGGDILSIWVFFSFIWGARR